MVKTTILFNGNSGKVVAKKRKRMSGTDGSRRREVKQMNPLYGHPNDYTAFEVRPMVSLSGSLDGGQNIYPWRLHKLMYPDQGSNSYQRIGNSIFLKNLRIKGYVYPRFNCLVKPINWRLKLYRFDSMYPQVTTHNAKNDVSAYMTLFNNIEVPADTGVALDCVAACRHNFYKAIKKYPKIVNYTCKTIASGRIQMTGNIESFGSTSFGNASCVTYGTCLTNFGSYLEDKGCYPLDINVKLNDRVTWQLDQTSTAMTANVFYFLVLEDDLGVGVEAHGASGNAGQATVTQPYYSFDVNNSANSCYKMSFFARWYYTDD